MLDCGNTSSVNILTSLASIQEELLEYVKGIHVYTFLLLMCIKCFKVIFNLPYAILQMLKNFLENFKHICI